MRSKQNLIFLFIIYEVMGPDPVYLPTVFVKRTCATGTNFNTQK